MEKKAFLERFAESLREFETKIALGSGLVVEEESLETFLDNGGGWLYDEGYINSTNRAFYHGMVNLFLENDMKVKVVSYDALPSRRKE